MVRSGAQLCKNCNRRFLQPSLSPSLSRTGSDAALALSKSVLCDSSAAVAAAARRGAGKRLKHIEVQNYHIQRLVDSGVLTVRKVSTDKNLADILTKYLKAPLFQKLLKLLGVEIINKFVLPVSAKSVTTKMSVELVKEESIQQQLMTAVSAVEDTVVTMIYAYEEMKNMDCAVLFSLLQIGFAMGVMITLLTQKIVRKTLVWWAGAGGSVAAVPEEKHYIETLKMDGLKEELRYRGLPTTGIRVDLMQRIRNADAEAGAPSHQQVAYATRLANQAGIVLHSRYYYNRRLMSGKIDEMKEQIDKQQTGRFQQPSSSSG